MIILLLLLLSLLLTTISLIDESAWQLQYIQL